MNYKIINSSEETLKELYDDNSFTFEGLDINDAQDLTNYLEGTGTLKKGLSELEIYNTKGSLMNSYYGLTGTNSYPEDLDIVSVKLSSFRSNMMGKLAIIKIQIGARWFNDIVDNNEARERRYED